MKGMQVGLVTAISVAFLAVGCGKQETQTAGEAGAIQAGVMEGPRTPAVATSTQGATGLAETTPQAGEPLPATADSLPPDVVAKASITTVKPGDVVEVTALGSTDVNEVILFDGLQKTSLVYDMEAKAWRTVYRVPMRTTADRVGLSVTARNAQNRWQRVWIFLEIQKEGSTEGEPDGC